MNNLMFFDRDEGLLVEHIKKDDEILFPWMDRNFSLNRINQLISKFNEEKMRGKGSLNWKKIY